MYSEMIHFRKYLDRLTLSKSIWLPYQLTAKRQMLDLYLYLDVLFPHESFQILKDSPTVLTWKVSKNVPNVHWKITFAPNIQTNQHVSANFSWGYLPCA